MTRQLVPRDAPERAEDEAGFTLIEVVAALFVFALLLAAVGGSLLQSIDLSRTNQQRITAANVAQRQIEAARTVPADQILTSAVLHTPPPPVEVGGTRYYIDQRVQYVDLGASGAQSCGGTDVARISVTVRWDRMDGVQPVRSDTVRYLDQSGLDPAKGSIAVVVQTAAGVPDEGLSVALSGPSGGRVVSTDSEGCAIFPQLPASTGGYTAELNTAGWIDAGGQQDSKVLNIDVHPSAATRVAMTYGPAATLALSFTGASVKLPVTPLLVSIRNAAWTHTVSMKSDGTYTVAVPPVPEGYQVWAGDCADARPSGWPGGAMPAAVAVSAGQTTQATAQVGSVDVSGAAAGTPVYAVHAPDLGCPSGEAIELGMSGGSDVVRALPYGHWTLAERPDALSAPAAAPPGGWVSVDVTPTGANPVLVAGRFN